MTRPLGPHQRDALARLAAAPDGLTTRDLDGNPTRRANTLRTLGDRGLAVTRRKVPSAHPGGSPFLVWEITEAGRAAIQNEATS